MFKVGIKLKEESITVMSAIDDAIIAYLHEAGGELEAQVKRNTRVGSGQLKGSWTYTVDEKKGVTTVGSPLENAIWEEFGTGEYALHGDGREGGWSYKDDRGKWHHTFGKAPHRAFWTAFDDLKDVLITRAEQVLKARMK